MEKITQVFVYGTLKPGGRYHESYCGGFQFEAKQAQVYGRLFSFPQLDYPGALENRSAWIQGFVLSFHHSEFEVFSKLDELEGYAANREKHLNEYYRKQVSAFDLDGEKISDAVWCYFMDRRKIVSLNGKPLNDGNWKV